jgi:hypothetical protein
MAGRLELADRPLSSEVVSIENLSSQGAQVITHQNWGPHEHLILMDLIGDFRVEAEVVYCLRLRDDAYVAGLRFACPVGKQFTRAADFA